MHSFPALTVKQSLHCGGTSLYNNSFTGIHRKTGSISCHWDKFVLSPTWYFTLKVFNQQMWKETVTTRSVMKGTAARSLATPGQITHFVDACSKHIKMSQLCLPQTWFIMVTFVRESVINNPGVIEKEAAELGSFLMKSCSQHFRLLQFKAKETVQL